jgi:hypothetical protein
MGKAADHDVCGLPVIVAVDPTFDAIATPRKVGHRPASGDGCSAAGRNIHNMSLDECAACGNLAFTEA